MLLRHFGHTPQQMARDLRETRALGDRLPSELLDHLRSLLPDVNVLFEVIMLDTLPANARVAALQHTDVDVMAAAADRVVLGNPAALNNPEQSVNAMSFPMDDLLSTLAPPFVPQHLQGAYPAVPAPPATPLVAAATKISRPPYKRTDTLCAVHAR